MKITTAMAVACLSVVGLAGGQNAQAVVRHYDLNIPKQSLDMALRDLAQQTGLQIALFSDTIDGNAVVGPILGTQSAEQALKTLLTPSGLSYKVVSEGTIAVLNPKDSPPPVSAPTGEVQRKSFWDRFRISQAEPSGVSERTENTAADARDEGESVRLEEIVVTAQKRAERLIDVPQSVSVLSADHLSKLGAVQFRDFASTVPGLSFATQGAGFTQISLRGVTAGIDIGPTVGVYLDEVPYGSSSSLTFSARLPLDVGLFDLDRIEVLRGPQGTLYGASSMGGLLKYVTKSPDVTHFGAAAQAGVSSTRHGDLNYNGAASVNVPIVTDRVALRASGFHSHDGGFVDNLLLGDENVDSADVSGGRLDLLLTPTDSLGIRITGFLQDISRDGKALVDLRTTTGAPVDGEFDQRRPVAEPYDQSFQLFSGTVTYDFGPATLTSVSAYQTGETDFISDVSAFFVPSFPTVSSWGTLNHQTTDRFTQEVRLASNNARPLEWVIGGFYSDEDTDLHQEYTIRDLAGQPFPNTFYNYSSPTTVEERAVFGDLTWHFSDRFDVTLGMRYADNRGTFETVGTGSNGVPRPLTHSSESVSTYLANARYRFGDSAIGYVRYATGYRPGGPNFVLRNPATGLLVGPDTFEADELSSYEAGFKAETDDRRFGIDIAAYYIDWTNIQIITTFGTAPFRASFRTNAPGGAAVKGAELTVTARPTGNITLTGAFAHTDAAVEEANTLGAREGERLPNVPRFSAALNADYSFASDGLRPSLGATLRHVSERTSAFGATALRLPEYTSVDLRTGFVLSSFNLQLYIHNLFDERGQTSPNLTNAGIPGVTSVSILQPRTIGINATTSF